MNLLFVNNIPFNPVAGGLERVTDVLAKELKRRGYSIYYLCGKQSQSQLYLLDYEFPAELYQLPRFGLFDNEENLSFYKRIQRELKIDIVINQRGLDGEFNNILPFTTVRLISVIHSVPDCYIPIMLGRLVDSSTPPFVGLKRFLKKAFPIIFQCYWKRKWLGELRGKYGVLAHYSDAIVTLSNVDGNILKKFISAEYRRQIFSIGNPNSFGTNCSFTFESKRKIILYVGRLDKEQKVPLRLLMIWKRLYLKYSEWQLKIVGDGEEKNAMQEYVKQENLSNVFFEGQKADVNPYYKEASFVCLTSNFEGRPMVLTEGMHYGCIPVTFNNYGAASEIIDDGINGCLIPAFDMEQYAVRLSELMSNDDKRIEMSKMAIEKVKLFSVGNVADKWEKLFQSL